MFLCTKRCPWKRLGKFFHTEIVNLIRFNEKHSSTQNNHLDVGNLLMEAKQKDDPLVFYNLYKHLYTNYQNQVLEGKSHNLC